MTWFVNDLSLCGQYADTAAFLNDLKELMQARAKLPVLQQRMYCSRELHTRPVTKHMDFREAVKSPQKIVPLQLVLAWLTKHGPFWEDFRQFNEDDYFELSGVDVTDQGIGEAARSQIMGREASTYSFSGGGFNYTPLQVQHGLAEEPLGIVEVANLWNPTWLSQTAQATVPLPENWAQMLEQAGQLFDNLYFSPSSIDPLKKEPFSNYVVERVFALLAVLQEFVTCLNPDGTQSPRNHELIEQHFSGLKAWFTDESVTNKRDFSEEMTFPDPESDGENVFCSWHGKVKSPQYRIHFLWPTASCKKFRIFYIGPKITKG